MLDENLRGELEESATTAVENLGIFLGNLNQIPPPILVRYARRLQLAAMLVETLQEKAWAAWEAGEEDTADDEELDENSDAFADHEDDETAWQHHIEAYDEIRADQ